MDVVTLGAALSIMKKMPDTAASSAAAAGASATAAQQAQQAAEAAAEQAEGAIEVDETLSVKGRAADAKVVGDKITSLKEDLNSYLEVDFSNLFYANEATGSKRINTNTGEAESADAQFAVSDYIPVMAGKEYVINFSYYSSASYGMAFYDSSKTYISGIKQSNSSSSGANNFVFTVPTEAAYIRISCWSNQRPFSDVTVTLNNGVISDRFDIEDLLGQKVIPLFTTTYELDVASVKTFDNCPILDAHRYTVIKKETSSRAITIVGCIKSGSWAGRGLFNYKSPTVTSFTATGNGSLAAAVNGVPVSGILSVFDTTGDDKLKAYIENLMAIPGEDVNLMPSNAIKRVIGIETNNYSTGKVLFVGDSQTQRNTFTSAFRILYAVRNNENAVDYYGYGGAGAREIAGFQGGVTLFAKPFTIPATTTAVEIELYTDTEPGHACAKQNAKGLTDIEIGGVVGSISYNSTDGKNYFTRAAPGSSVIIDRPTIVRSSLSYLTHSTLIVEVGTNDTIGATEESLSSMLKSVIRSMIRYNATEQYIVLGLTAKVENLDVAKINNDLSEEFGNHFIDDRSYLIEYGLEDEEITPTAQDEIDIANGEIPSSLRDDAIHFNQYGGNVIGKLIYNRGKCLGYWL